MSDNEARYTVRSLFVTGIATIIATVLVLELSGRIDHTEDKGKVPVGDFKAIHIQPGDSFRMSRKSSELHAACQDGYLAIAADADPSFRGILVDYKNRGVRCQRPSPMDPDPAANSDERSND